MYCQKQCPADFGAKNLSSFLYSWLCTFDKQCFQKKQRVFLYFPAAFFEINKPSTQHLP